MSGCRWVLLVLLVTGFCLPACGDDNGGNTDEDTTADIEDLAKDSGDAGDTAEDSSEDQSSDGEDTVADQSVDADDAVDSMEDAAEDMVSGMCDFEAVDGIVVIQAESLPVVEDWSIEQGESGYTGDGYISWTGNSMNNSPGSGVMEVSVRITEAGRYRFQWYNRIGMGTNATEHNDTWVKFPDADDYYGLNVNSGEESRRYPQPQCDDTGFMDSINGLTEVTEARCAEGSSSDGWMKVYSSGATDWRWSTRTSDNDAHDIYAEFLSPGIYTVSISARGDFHLIDRIHIHQEAIENDAATDLGLAETTCP